MFTNESLSWDYNIVFSEIPYIVIKKNDIFRAYLNVLKITQFLHKIKLLRRLSGQKMISGSVSVKGMICG